MSRRTPKPKYGPAGVVVRRAVLLCAALLAAAGALWISEALDPLMAPELGPKGLDDGLDLPWRKFSAADYGVTVYFHTIHGPPDPTTLVYVRRGFAPLDDLGLLPCDYDTRPVWREGDVIHLSECATVASYDLPTGRVTRRR